MNPKNFPGKKNARRLRAIARIEAKPAKYPDRDATLANTMAAMAATGRHTRTKKNRAASAPFGRT